MKKIKVEMNQSVIEIFEFDELNVLPLTCMQGWLKQQRKMEFLGNFISYTDAAKYIKEIIEMCPKKDLIICFNDFYGQRIRFEWTYLDD